MAIYVKASDNVKKFGVLNFYCQRKRVNKDTVIPVNLNHDVQKKIDNGVLIVVKNMPKATPATTDK